MQTGILLCVCGDLANVFSLITLPSEELVRCPAVDVLWCLTMCWQLLIASGLLTYLGKLGGKSE